MPHALMFCLLIAIFAALWTLWSRRATFTMAFDQGISLTLLLAVAGVVLTHGLQDHSSNLVDLIGCTCFMAAVAAIAHTTAAMVLAPSVGRNYGRRMIIEPAAAGWVFMIVMFVLNHGGYFFAHRAYWLTFAVTVGYLTCIEIFALRVLRRETRHRLTADLFLVAAVCGVVACLIRAYFGPHGHSTSMLVLLIISMGTFSTGANLSWRRKRRLASKPKQERDSGVVEAKEL